MSITSPRPASPGHDNPTGPFHKRHQNQARVVMITDAKRWNCDAAEPPEDGQAEFTVKHHREPGIERSAGREHTTCTSTLVPPGRDLRSTGEQRPNSTS